MCVCVFFCICFVSCGGKSSQHHRTTNGSSELIIITTHSYSCGVLQEHMETVHGCTYLWPSLSESNNPQFAISVFFVCLFGLVLSSCCTGYPSQCRANHRVIYILRMLFACLFVCLFVVVLTYATFGLKKITRSFFLERIVDIVGLFSLLVLTIVVVVFCVIVFIFS